MHRASLNFIHIAIGLQIIQEHGRKEHANPHAHGRERLTVLTQDLEDRSTTVASNPDLLQASQAARRRFLRKTRFLKAMECNEAHTKLLRDMFHQTIPNRSLSSGNVSDPKAKAVEAENAMRRTLSSLGLFILAGIVVLVLGYTVICVRASVAPEGDLSHSRQPSMTRPSSQEPRQTSQLSLVLAGYSTYAISEVPSFINPDCGLPFGWERCDHRGQRLLGPWRISKGATTILR